MKLDAVCSDNPYIYHEQVPVTDPTGSVGAIAAYRACYAAGYDFPFQTVTTNVTNFLDWSYEVI